MMSARYRFQHLASVVFRHGPDVGLMSFPMSSLSDIGLMSARYRFRHRTSVAFRHRPDIESISARCRPDIVDDIWPTSSPRANMESVRYKPTFADIGPIYFADFRPLSWPTFADIGPTSSLYSFQTSARHRVYVGLISLTTSGRHRAHVQTWSRPDISRHLPISARYILPTSGRCRGRHLPISGRHRAAMVSRHRPDIESISARCRPDIVDDIWPTSSPRANMESARYQPTFADIGPI